jgi:hypothetical protein
MAIMSVLIPDCAYVRELKRPWKLSTFAAGMTWLFYGALTYGFGDWDVGVSMLMGGLTYLCAPWSVRVIWICLRDRPQWWWLWLAAALILAWAVIDGSYVAYNTLMRHPMQRAENFRASAALYFLAGIVWFYRGTLRQLAQEIRCIRMNRAH